MKSYINQFDEYWNVAQGICDTCSITFNFAGWITYNFVQSCKCANCGVQEVINELHNCNSYVCAKARL
jgi:hypothetical protein